MFYYIRHFLLSEKLYAIFLWHGKTIAQSAPKNQMRREVFSRRSYSFFYRFGTFVQA